jgi:4-amino-4-deoxy-L-arabinose transferase-like glycosyltransferase
LNANAKSSGIFSTPALGVAAAIVVCLFGQLGALGLTGPDEPRYVWIARAMAQTGDWVTPRLYGQPWFEKPILYYWAAAIGFRLHFSAEWAARLPSALGALAVLAATALLARRLYGRSEDWARDPATVATIVFATSVAATGFARAATPDMLFSAAIDIAMVCAAAMFADDGALRASGASPTGNHASRKPLLLVSFGVVLGLGVLAKGPAAVILVGGALFVWALATGKWRKVTGLAHPFALAAFFIVALPWYVLCALRNPDFLRVFILQHNFERYLTPVFQHRQPFWFFGPITLAAMLPWTALLLPAARESLRLWREKSWHDSPGFFFACFAIFPVLFFSFSQSKLPSYALPAIPALALVCAIAWIRTIALGRRSVAQVGALLAISWFGLAVGGYVFIRHFPWSPHLPSSIYAALGLLLVGGALIAVFGMHGSSPWVIGLCWLCFVMAVEAANLEILPQLQSHLSARYYGEFLRYYAHPERLFLYQVPRSWDYGLAFYFGRQLPEWSPSDPDAALVLSTRQGSAAITQMQRSIRLTDEPPAKDALVLVPVTVSPHVRK